MTHRFVATLLILGLAGNAATLTAQSPIPAASKKATPKGKAKPAPTFPIAVVDMTLAMGHTKAMRAGMKRIGQMTRQFNDTLKKLTEDIKRLDGEISVMNTSPERWELQIELAAKARRQETARKLYDAALNREGGKMQAAAYRELEKAIAELAKKKSILLVLRKRTHQTVEDVKKLGGKASDAEKRQATDDRLRDILYAAPSVDLTDDLIEYLKG